MKKEEKFSFDTIEDFDKHIDISIPNYSGLIEHVVDLSTNFVKEDSICYDLGCSTGKLLTKIESRNKDRFEKAPIYIGIDKSENLAKGEEKENFYIENDDLNSFVLNKSSLTMSIFTLQFLSIEDRKSLIEKTYNSLEEGGAFIVAEKCFHRSGFFQDIFNFTYYDFKHNSFSYEEILQKQIDLRYIMRPITSEENEAMFRNAGFTMIETFWQSLNFKAWLLIK